MNKLVGKRITEGAAADTTVRILLSVPHHHESRSGSVAQEVEEQSADGREYVELCQARSSQGE